MWCFQSDTLECFQFGSSSAEMPGNMSGRIPMFYFEDKLQYSMFKSFFLIKYQDEQLKERRITVDEMYVGDFFKRKSEKNQIELLEEALTKWRLFFYERFATYKFTEPYTASFFWQVPILGKRFWRFLTE